MIKKLAVLCVLAFFAASFDTFSIEFNTGERIKLHSSTLKQERFIQILLPENYQSNPEATYPVIYLVDGDYTFHGVSGMLDFLANKGQLIPDVILVAIADQGTEQYRQYMTPTGLTTLSDQKETGKAAQFLTFLTNEVKPYIKRHYRTADNATLVGHSMGGLFVVNALLESPSAFEHFISVSPSIWLNDHAIMTKAEQVISKGGVHSASLYLSLGDENRSGIYGLIQLLDEAQPKNIHWHFAHYPNENHNSVGLVALRNNLKSIFEGWFISDSDLSKVTSPHALVQQYKQLQLALKINQPIPTPSIKAAIRSFYRQQKTDDIPAFMAKVKEELPASEQAFLIMQASYTGHFDSPEAALNILLASQERYAHSIDYLLSIAATYEQLQNTELALSYYSKALTLAKQYKSNQWRINIIEAKMI